MTNEMLEKARRNVQTVGAKNVTFKHGFMEDLPVEDEWADLVISNGSVNLTQDKNAVFQEFHRVFKPGGRLQIADNLVAKPIPDGAKRRVDLWAG